MPITRDGHTESEFRRVRFQICPTSASVFCLRRSLPQAYKPLFFFFIISKVKILKEMTNKLKKCYDTKLIGVIN